MPEPERNLVARIAAWVRAAAAIAGTVEAMVKLVALAVRLASVLF